MKNRFTSLVLVLIMAFCIICSPVSAADDATISVEKYTLNGMEVVIKGITGPVTSDYLTVVVIGKDVTESPSQSAPEYRYVGALKSIAVGKFGDININLNYEQSNEPKKYAISVHLDSREATCPKTIELTYCNAVKFNEMIADAVEYKPAQADQEGQNVVAYMAGSEDMQIFEDSGVWISEYEAMEQEMKAVVNSAVGKVYSELTSATLNEIVNGSIIACTMANDEVDEVLNKLKKYEEELFAPEDESTWVFGIKGKEKENGSVPMIAFKHLDEATQKWVAETVKNNAQTVNTPTYEGMQKDVKQGMLLSMVNTEHYSYLEKLLTENTDILDGDWSAFTSLTSQKNRNTVMQDVKVDDNNEPVEYKSVAELLDAVNIAVAALSNDSGNGGNGGGSGGSSGGGGGSGGSGGSGKGDKGDITLTLEYEGIDESNTPSANKKFVDMAGFEWATEAVESLQNKGILSGVGEGRFEPSRAITREEFVKLICEAFGFGKSTNKVKFSDVSSNEWYAPYIGKAYELGIINGISESAFGVGATLTREDMAVITCRALEYAGAELNYTAKNFADADTINDYALNSVNALANAGVVKGVGDDRFMPKNSGLRAEVAVILYRCLNEFEIN